MVNLSTPNDQLYKELCDDYTKAQYWHRKHYGGDKKYSEFQDRVLADCMRSRKDFTGETIEYVSKNGNHWLTFESCRYFPDSHGAHTSIHAFCYYETCGSIGVFRLLGDGNGHLNGVVIFTSHFFERICERLDIKKLDSETRKKLLVKNFINMVPAMIMKPYPRDEHGRVRIDVRIPGSLGRGFLREGGKVPVYEIRTYLTDKQLFNSQKRDTVQIREKADKVTHQYEPEMMRTRRLLMETHRDGIEAVMEREIQNACNLGTPRQIVEQSAIAGIAIMSAIIDDKLVDPNDIQFWQEHGTRNADIINDYAIKCYYDKGFNWSSELLKLAGECIKRDNLQKKCHMKVIAKSIMTKVMQISEEDADKMVANLSDKL